MDFDIDDLLNDEEMMYREQEGDDGFWMPPEDEEEVSAPTQGNAVRAATASAGTQNRLRSPLSDRALLGLDDDDDDILTSKAEGSASEGDKSKKEDVIAARLRREGLGLSRLMEQEQEEDAGDGDAEDWRQFRETKSNRVGDAGAQAAGRIAKRKRTEASHNAGRMELVNFGLGGLGLITRHGDKARDWLKPEQHEGYLRDKPPFGMKSVTLMTGGERIKHVIVREEIEMDVSKDAWLLDAAMKGGSLLRVPISTLIAKADKQRFQQEKLREKRAEAEYVSEQLAGPKTAQDLFLPKRISPGKEGAGKEPESQVLGSESGERQREELWVDKYAPTAFAHLLSEEAINREVLRNLRLWDEYVFHRAPPKIFLEPPTTNSSTGWSQQPKKFKEPVVPVTDPKDKRPQVKVILLCGPPGMGKTTLAHVVATHCGYRPFEINASDDRSAPALKDKMLQAMQTKTLSADQRPHCIILDEVDGIDGKTGIKLIVDMINAPLKGGSKQAGSVPPLTRPLICICNQLYTPSLRPLRDVALVCRFRKTSSSRLLQRLRTICSAESLPLTSAALSALCEASGNDVRASLNTLQFFKNRQDGSTAHDSNTPGEGGGLSWSLSRELIQFVEAGLKDQERDLNQVCTMIFRKPVASATAALNREAAKASKRSPGDSASGKQQDHKAEAARSAACVDCDQVLEGVRGFGEYSQMLLAIHENLPTIRFVDPTMVKTALALEWLTFSDTLMGAEHHGQFYGLAPELYCHTAAVVHLLCRIELRPRITLPRKEYEYRRALTTRQAIVQSFMEGCWVQAPWARNARVVLQDVLSPLLTILSPALRAANPELYSPSEKATLRHLSHAMLHTGISFREPVLGGSQDVEMVPAIDQLAVFQGAMSSGGFGGESQPMPHHRSRVLPPFVKLVATQESKLEAMKLLEEKRALASKGEDRRNPADGTSVTSAVPAGKQAVAQKPVGSLLGKKRPSVKEEEEQARLKKIREEPVSAPKTWFVKLGVKKSTTSKANSADSHTDNKGGVVEGESCNGPSAEAKKDKVRFKFQAGFTNAIRRPVYLKDLL